MPFPTGTFIDFLRSSYSVIADEFDHLYAQVEGYLRKEHKADGSHGAITADSTAVRGGGTFGGNVTADGIALGSLTSFAPGVPIKHGITFGRWALVSTPANAPATSGQELQAYDLDHATRSVLRLVYDTGNARFLLGFEPGAALALGEDTAGRRIAFLAAGDIAAVQMTVGGAQQFGGIGSPEGVVTATVGATYQRVDGGAGSTFYVKETGTGATGWRAI